jgi:hypothetical protein
MPLLALAIAPVAWGVEPLTLAFWAAALFMVVAAVHFEPEDTNPRHTAELVRCHSPSCPRRGAVFARRAGRWMMVMTVPLIAALMLVMEGRWPSVS